MRVNVLGTFYRIIRVKVGQDEFMDKMHYGGCCDGNFKEIYLLDLKSAPDWEKEPEEKRLDEEKRTLRHEIFHTFPPSGSFGCPPHPPGSPQDGHLSPEEG